MILRTETVNTVLRCLTRRIDPNAIDMVALSQLGIDSQISTLIGAAQTYEGTVGVVPPFVLTVPLGELMLAKRLAGMYSNFAVDVDLQMEPGAWSVSVILSNPEEPER